MGCQLQSKTISVLKDFQQHVHQGLSIKNESLPYLYLLMLVEIFFLECLKILFRRIMQRHSID